MYRSQLNTEPRMRLTSAAALSHAYYRTDSSSLRPPSDSVLIHGHERLRTWIQQFQPRSEYMVSCACVCVFLSLSHTHTHKRVDIPRERIFDGFSDVLMNARPENFSLPTRVKIMGPLESGIDAGGVTSELYTLVIHFPFHMHAYILLIPLPRLCVQYFTQVCQSSPAFQRSVGSNMNCLPAPLGQFNDSLKFTYTRQLKVLLFDRVSIQVGPTVDC